MSDVDFERAQTDIEDELDSYYEEEVTDDEAMEVRAREIASKNNQGDQKQNVDEDDEDSDMGFYMPTVIAKNKPDSAEKDKSNREKTTTGGAAHGIKADQLPKITKIVRRKRKRATNSGRRPPARADLKSNSPSKLVLGNQDNRKSYTMSDDAAGAMKLSNPTSGPQMLIGESTFSASNMKASAAQQ